MTLTFTEEHRALRASVRRFLQDKAPSEAVRKTMDSEAGHDPGVWNLMAGQLGLQGLALPEECGGSGFGPVELGIVLEELGRALSPEPFLSTVAFVGRALATSEDQQLKERWLPGIADGTVRASLAVNDTGGWGLDAVATTAEPDGAAYRLTGAKSVVLDGEGADLILVVARADDGPALFAVDASAAPEGLSRRRLDVLDPTRRLARVVFGRTPAHRVQAPPAHLRGLLDAALIAVASEQIGAASACLDAAVEYAKIRVQFGRPIGSFQAIKHKCADMILDLEAARSATYHAISLLAEGADPPEVSAAAAVCAAWCGDMAMHLAKENIQIHGGIGFTWEHDAHLYLKRVKSSELIFGTSTLHRARLADLLGM